MIFRKLFLILSLGLVCHLNLSAHEKGNTTTTLNWYDENEAAFAEAKKTGKPILAVFR